MGFDLTGRTALITGGTRGLGLSMAREVALAGADVVITGRDKDRLDSVADELRSASGRTVWPLAKDQAERSQVVALAAEALAMAGQIDIVINNAGVNVPAAVDEITDADWDLTIDTNLTSSMILTRALCPSMKERGWGRFLFVTSTFGRVSRRARASYSAAKAGLMGFARAAALDLGPHGITVNCIGPGPFRTDMAARHRAPGTDDEFAARTALQRWGEPAELAGPALMLVSDAGSFVTGATYFVDGGYTVS